MTDDELSKTINETCDCSCENGRYYVCGTDRQIYYDPAMSINKLENENLTECEVGTQSEALAKWLAIKLSEKSFRGKKWIFYKEEVEPTQMTIFEFMEG